jgi:hypothetical protein
MSTARVYRSYVDAYDDVARTNAIGPPYRRRFLKVTTCKYQLLYTHLVILDFENQIVLEYTADDIRESDDESKDEEVEKVKKSLFVQKQA